MWTSPFDMTPGLEKNCVLSQTLGARASPRKRIPSLAKSLESWWIGAGLANSEKRGTSHFLLSCGCICRQAHRLNASPFLQPWLANTLHIIFFSSSADTLHFPFPFRFTSLLFPFSLYCFRCLVLLLWGYYGFLSCGVQGLLDGLALDLGW